MQKLFGLEFKKLEGIDTYHEDVMTFKVLDNDSNFVAIFYADFFQDKAKEVVLDDIFQTSV